MTLGTPPGLGGKMPMSKGCQVGMTSIPFLVWDWLTAVIWSQVLSLAPLPGTPLTSAPFLARLSMRSYTENTQEGC